MKGHNKGSEAKRLIKPGQSVDVVKNHEKPITFNNTLFESDTYFLNTKYFKGSQLGAFCPYAKVYCYLEF